MPTSLRGAGKPGSIAAGRDRVHHTGGKAAFLQAERQYVFKFCSRCSRSSPRRSVTFCNLA